MKVTTNQNGIFISNDGKVLAFPFNSLIVEVEDASDMVLFKSSANGDVIASGVINDITINGASVTKDTVGEVFASVANKESQGGGGAVIEKDLYRVVSVLPSSGEANILYLVPKADSEGDIDRYDEYLWVNGKFELVGSVSADIDLSGYYTKEQVDQSIGDAYAYFINMVDDKADKNNVYTKNEVYTKQEVDDKVANAGGGGSEPTFHEIFKNKSNPYNYSIIYNIFTQENYTIYINKQFYFDIDLTIDEVKVGDKVYLDNTHYFVFNIENVDKENDSINGYISYNAYFTIDNGINPPLINSVLYFNYGHLGIKIFNPVKNKQDKLTSGSNIKTINGQSILGSGNLEIQGGGGSADAEELKSLREDVENALGEIATLEADKQNKLPDFYVGEVTLENDYQIQMKKIWFENGVWNGTFRFNMPSINGEQIMTTGWEAQKNFDLLTPTQANQKYLQKEGEYVKAVTSNGGAINFEKGNGTPDVVNFKTINGQSIFGMDNINVPTVWSGSQSQYDALGTYDSNTIYLILEG